MSESGADEHCDLRVSAIYGVWPSSRIERPKNEGDSPLPLRINQQAAGNDCCPSFATIERDRSRPNLVPTGPKAPRSVELSANGPESARPRLGFKSHRYRHENPCSRRGFLPLRAQPHEYPQVPRSAEPGQPQDVRHRTSRSRGDVAGSVSGSSRRRADRLPGFSCGYRAGCAV